MAAIRTLLAYASKLIDGIYRVTAILGGCLILFMMLSITYDVVMRYLFRDPSTWVSDSNGLLLYALTFLATGWVLKRESHVSVDIVLICLSDKNRLLLQGILSFVALLVSIVILIQTTIDAVHAYQRDELLWLAFTLPKHFLLWLIPFGFLLVCFQFIRRGLNYLTLFGQIRAQNKKLVK